MISAQTWKVIYGNMLYADLCVFIKELQYKSSILNLKILMNKYGLKYNSHCYPLSKNTFYCYHQTNVLMLSFTKDDGYKMYLCFYDELV